MEPIVLADRPGLQIDGYPNAVKVLALPGPIAKRVADLALHNADLRFALECLDAINIAPAEPRTLRQALWCSAVVHCLKCYGDSNARSQLSAQKVLRGEPPEAMEVFEYFKSLRNKHVVHDENSYTQSLPGAILNNVNQPHKIEKIITLSVFIETLDQEQYSNLRLLVEKSIDWVRSEYDRLCNKLTADLESRPYEELLAMTAVEYRKPTDGAVHVSRKAI